MLLNVSLYVYFWPYGQEHRKEKKIKLLEKEIFKITENDFNIGSPKQLGEILFETLGLNRKKSRRTKTGWSTDANVLEKLEAGMRIKIEGMQMNIIMGSSLLLMYLLIVMIKKLFFI